MNAWVVTESTARTIAENEARTAKYDLSAYRVVSIVRDELSGWHFIVYVDGTSGAPLLLRGE